jgi:hypothetical protein
LWEADAHEAFNLVTNVVRTNLAKVDGWIIHPLHGDSVFGMHPDIQVDVHALGESIVTNNEAAQSGMADLVKVHVVAGEWQYIKTPRCTQTSASEADRLTRGRPGRRHAGAAEACNST